MQQSLMNFFFFFCLKAPPETCEPTDTTPVFMILTFKVTNIQVNSYMPQNETRLYIILKNTCKTEQVNSDIICLRGQFYLLLV